MALTGYKTNSYPYTYQLIKITSNSTRLRGYWKNVGTGWVGLRNEFFLPNYDKCRGAVEEEGVRDDWWWDYQLPEGSLHSGSQFESMACHGGGAMREGAGGSWLYYICTQEADGDGCYSGFFLLFCSVQDHSPWNSDTKVGWGFLPQWTRSRNSLTDVLRGTCSGWFCILSDWQY